MILLVLQCAYSHDGRALPMRLWKWALMNSYTGRRMLEYLPEEVEFEVINASPQIGTHSSAVFPADIEHIKSQLDIIPATIIVGCGKIAQAGLEELGVEHIKAPHPAWRQLSKKHSNEIRNQILEKLNDKYALCPPE